ncbi:MAG TPA: cupin domain-containing protein [Chthoniobacterales bacterium]|nr:cupin domain-containing protein [Chthoniobacterales bacterium]
MRKTILALSLAAAVVGLTIAAENKSDKSADKGAAGSTHGQHKFFSPSDLTWVDAPPSLPPGAKMAVLDGDPNKAGSFTVRLQTPAGYKIPPHTHPAAERITVISGSINLGMGDKFDEAAGKEMGVGSFVVLPAAGMSHYAWSNGEAIVQIHSEGPFKIKYVNAADDPRSKKQ